MLAIRLQRVGRKGYAMYRMAVQEAQRHPSSGRVVAYVGTYDPHTKESKVQVELVQKYLDNGAQPSPRVVKLLKAAGVKMPKWVSEPASDKAKAIRHQDKLRRNRPAEPEAPAEPGTPAAEAEEAAEASEAAIAEEAAEETAPEAEVETTEATEAEPEK